MGVWSTDECTVSNVKPAIRTILKQPDPEAKVYVSGNRQTPNKSAKGGTREGVKGCQAPHPNEPHSGGRGGRSNVLTRVPLCQYQTPPSSSFSPTQTAGCPQAAATRSGWNACSRSRSCLWLRRAEPTRQSRAGAHQREQVQETPLKPVLGENREDLQKKECRRSARNQQLLNPVSGERHEDPHGEKESLHQHRTAPQSAQKCVLGKHEELLNSVLDEKQEDCHNLHDQELECQRCAPALRCDILCSGRNLEDCQKLHELRQECQRPAPYSAVKKNKIRALALPPAVPPAVPPAAEHRGLCEQRGVDTQPWAPR